MGAFYAEKVLRDGEVIWKASSLDLQGCNGYGLTIASAVEDLERKESEEDANNF